jgi:hypothetical protein
MGSFTNNLSYFEVFGSAHLNAPTIRDIGLKHDGVERTDTTVYDQAVLTCISNARSKGGVFLNLRISRCGDSTPTTTDITIPDVAMSDSLFYIHGNVYGNQASFESSTYSAFNHYVDMAAQNAMYSTYGIAEGVVDSFNVFTGEFLSTSNAFSTTIEGDSLLVTNTHSVSSAIPCDLLIVCSNSNPPVEQSYEFSLVEELAKIWETVKTWFTSLLAEIDWWS